MKVVRNKPSVGTSAKSASTSTYVPAKRELKGKIAIPDSGFVYLEEPDPVSISLIVGSGKSGKTSYVTRSAPDPVALINFDGRAKHAVRYAMEEMNRDILYSEISAPEISNKTTSEAGEELNISDAEERAACGIAIREFLHDYGRAIATAMKGKIRTIAIDTVDNLSDLCTVYGRGYLDSGRDYGKSKNYVNRTIRHIVSLARMSKVHLVLLAQEREIWVGNEATGKFTCQGNDMAQKAVDWVGRVSLDMKIIKAGKITKESVQGIKIQVMDAGINEKELFKIYKAKDWDELGMTPFGYANMMQYPKTNPVEWIEQ